MDFIIRNNGAKIRKTIHLIRHGQTDYNLSNIIQGSGIDSELNTTGRTQALRFYEAYKDYGYKRIYTSTLKRAVQSVEPFILSGIPHTAEPGLNEINWGIMEGRAGSENNADIYKQMIDAWSAGRLDIAVDGGESPLEMFRRQTEAYKNLMSASHEDIILVCMHGRAIRSFLCLLTETPLHEMEKWEHSNLCLYELEFNGNAFDVTKENDISHLMNSNE